MPGPGLIHEKRIGDTNYILLYNFDVASDAVKPEHRYYLTAKIAHLFQKPKPPRIFLTGMASRTGGTGYNLGLSRRRVEEVIRVLRGAGVPASQMIRSDFVGEAKSKLPDGTENDWDRAVRITVTYDPTPPPPPPDDGRDPVPPPDPQEVERQIDRLVRRVQDGNWPPRVGAGDDRYREEVSRYLGHIEGYQIAMKEILRRGRGDLPIPYLFYPNPLQAERRGFEKAVDAWRELGDTNLERQRTPPHAHIEDTPMQRELIQSRNFGRINTALERYYQDERRRLGA